MSLPPREPPDLRNPSNRPGGSGQQPQPPNWGQQQPGWPPPQQPQYPPQRGTGPLGPTQPPQLGGYQGGIPPAQPPQLGGSGGFFQDALHERRIEYLAWGSVVIIMGFSIILMALNTEVATNILLIGAPLLSGMILLGSGFVQRLFFGYNVSLGTWAIGVLGISFGCTRTIAEITDSGDAVNQIIYFVGLLVIISGLIIILQVFRPSHR